MYLSYSEIIDLANKIRCGLSLDVTNNIPDLLEIVGFDSFEWPLEQQQLFLLLVRRILTQLEGKNWLAVADDLEYELISLIESEDNKSKSAKKADSAISEINPFGLNRELSNILKNVSLETLDDSITRIKGLVLPVRNQLEITDFKKDTLASFVSLNQAFWSRDALEYYVKITRDLVKDNGEYLKIVTRSVFRLMDLGSFNTYDNLVKPILLNNIAKEYGASFAWKLSNVGDLSRSLDLFNQISNYIVWNQSVAGDYAVTMARNGDLNAAKEFGYEFYKKSQNIDATDVFARIGWVLADLNMVRESREFFTLDHSVNRLSPEWQRNQLKLDALDYGIEYAVNKMEKLYSQYIHMKDGFAILSWVLLCTAPPHFLKDQRSNSLVQINDLILRDLKLGRITAEWRKNYGIICAARNDNLNCFRYIWRAYTEDAFLSNGFSFAATEYEMNDNSSHSSVLFMLDYLLGRMSGDKCIDFATRVSNKHGASIISVDEICSSDQLSMLSSLCIGQIQ